MTIILTFLLTTVALGALGFLALRRVAIHLKENPEGIEAVSKHVLLPLLGRKSAAQPEGPASSDAEDAADR
jgi:hypothetical protein